MLIEFIVEENLVISEECAIYPVSYLFYPVSIVVFLLFYNTQGNNRDPFGK